MLTEIRFATAFDISFWIFHQCHMSGVLGGNSAKNKRRNPEDSHEDGNEASAQNAQSPHVEQNMLPQSQSVKDPNQPSYSSMAQTESELESTQSQRENPGGLNTAEKPEQVCAGRSFYEYI